MITTNEAWPILKHYDARHLARIALPLGGIGTGTVSLGGRGDHSPSPASAGGRHRLDCHAVKVGIEEPEGREPDRVARHRSSVAWRPV